MEIKGLKTNCLVIGEGSPILILHGWGSSSLKWQRAGELLAEKGFKVIVPDLPGFGKTEQPKEAWGLDEYSSFVQDLVGQMNLSSFVLAGHSFGGALAVKMALNNPIKKVFLIGPALIRTKTLKKRIIYLASKILKPFAFPLARRAFYKVVKSDYSWQKGIMKESYLKVIKEDLTPLLKEVKSKVVLVFGEKDNITDLKQAKMIKERIGSSSLEIVKGAGHDLEISCPEQLVKIILNHIWE